MPKIKEDKDAASGSESDTKDIKDDAIVKSDDKADVDEELSPKRKRKDAPTKGAEVNEELLEGDEKLKLEQRRAYNRACAAKARKRSKDLIASLQEQVESLTRDKAQLERTNDVMRAQLDLLEQQNRSIMQSQQRAGPMQMHHMQAAAPQMQAQMGMMQAAPGQAPIYITQSGQPAYATTQAGHYIEVQQQPGAVGMPAGATMAQVARPAAFPQAVTRMVQQGAPAPATTAVAQASQTSSPGGSTPAPAAAGGSGSMDQKYFLS